MDTRPFTSARFGTGGYEVSSKGDTRFSALFAKMPNGRTLEQIYQLDLGYKGWDPGGSNWRLGKGKPGKDPSIDLTAAYLGLWRQWASLNLLLMRELYLAVRATPSGTLLTDCFASTPNSQAWALSVVLNELCGYSSP